MTNSDVLDLKMIYVVVYCGMGSEILQKSKQHGIKGGTVFLGKGITDNRFLKFFAICDVRKEIVMMAADGITADYVLDVLDEEFGFGGERYGMAYTISVNNITGARCYQCGGISEKGEEKAMYQAITVIVDKGNGERVIEAAEKAGSKSGVIINARGSGIHETSRIFAMDIEPEKEVVMILASSEKTPLIVEMIRKDLKIDEPGNGIIFTQSVNRVCGFSE